MGTVCRLTSKKKARNQKKKRAYELLEKSEKKSAVPTTLVIKEKETVMVHCQYCGALMKSTSTRCPNCGAPRRR